MFSLSLSEHRRPSSWVGALAEFAEIIRSFSFPVRLGHARWAGGPECVVQAGIGEVLVKIGRVFPLEALDHLAWGWCGQRGDALDLLYLLYRYIGDRGRQDGLRREEKEHAQGGNRREL